MAYGIDQFVFVNDRNQMYYNSTGVPQQVFIDQLLVNVSDGLLQYFSGYAENTILGIQDCYEGAFNINTAPLGTGGPYNG